MDTRKLLTTTKTDSRFCFLFIEVVLMDFSIVLSSGFIVFVEVFVLI